MDFVELSKISQVENIRFEHHQFICSPLTPFIYEASTLPRVPGRNVFHPPYSKMNAIAFLSPDKPSNDNCFGGGGGGRRVGTFNKR